MGIFKKLFGNKSATVTPDVEKDNLPDAEELYQTGQRFKANGDLSKAISLFTVAADKGNVDAQYELGYMYSQGIGVEVDNALAIHYLKASSAQKHIGALDSLAHHLFHGIGCERDEKTAVMFMKLTAEHGCVGSQRNLGSLYLSGKCSFLPINVDEGLKWLTKAALDNEHPASFDAQFDIGAYYWLLSHGGLAHPEYILQAKEWFTLAAQNGHAAAQHALNGPPWNLKN